MLNFKPLTLDDEIFFKKFLNPYNFETCEYSFLNLFIWRKGCNIQYSVTDDALILKKTDFDGNCHFMQPLGYKKENLKSIMNKLFEYKKEFNLKYLIKDGESSFINDFREIYGDSFTIEEDRNNFDYIYESKRLINLSGKVLHKKKNHCNHFTKNYNYHIEPISPGVVEECIQASIEWCKMKNCNGYLLYELDAIEELLRNITKLDFEGMVVYVDHKLSAFTIGERVNEKMAVIHIEKADPDINGLYSFINRTFVDRYFSDVPYINREQDLGIEGLRKAKESYKPVIFGKKFIIK